jgi:hypothetical protein
MGLSQRSFGVAVYKIAKQPIAPAYAQKKVSHWEVGTLLPPENLQPIICAILKIDPSEISFAQSGRIAEDFIDLLVGAGLEKMDAELLRDNNALQAVALKAIVKRVHHLCDEFCSFKSNLDSAS